MKQVSLNNVGQLVDWDFTQVANLLNVEVAALKAMQEVETGGRGGFFAPNKPAILFEGHIFWKQLKRKGIELSLYVSGNEDILYPDWNKAYYKGGLAEYDRLERARQIDRDAADSSASWGMFQVMGFNHKACGVANITEFVAAMCESELMQLRLTTAFIQSQEEMLTALQSLNWARFAYMYNGPRYAENQYAQKLTAAYLKHAKGITTLTE